MKTPLFAPYLKSIPLGLLAILLCQGSLLGGEMDLGRGFENPPIDCRPGAWWRFFGDVMTPKGAEEDVRELAQAGVREVQMVQLVGKPKGGEGVFMSPFWWEVMRAGGKEAGKQGIKISPSHMTGWSTGGGPWIPADKSMQKLVWSANRVEGHGPVTLVHPETVLKYYRDVAVLAYPVSGEIAADLSLKPAVTLLEGQTKDDLSLLVDGNPETAVKFVTKGDFPPTEFLALELNYPRPVTVRSLMIDPFVEGSHAAGQLSGYGGELQAETAPEKFTTIAKITPGATIFAPTKAQRFRIRMHVPSAFVGRQLREIDLSPEIRLHHFAYKAGYYAQQQWSAHPEKAEVLPMLDPASVVDLTDKLDDQGKLNWSPPQGVWVVMRLGQTSSNRPTRNPAVPGLESDKFDPEATRLHFASYVEKVAKTLNQDSPGLVDEIFMDSWEGGSQNWTAKMPQEFRKRRGYELTPYLLTLTGRIVGSVDQTERFLWDYRHTLGDLLADNFYGVMAAESHRLGAKLTSQAPGPLHSVSPTADFLQCWGRVDIPMGEYLNPPKLSLGYNPKEATSAAHIYGRPVITAEDFSLFWTKESEGGDIHGGGQFNSPRELLRAQYLGFCEGLNRVTLTCFVHQADRTQGTVKDPGWGPVLNAQWFALAKGYTDYLTRCQYLLRQGLFVADICYFYGEGAPNSLHHLYQPDLKTPVRSANFVKPFPAGYDYDECNAEAMLTRMNVKEGRLILPDGMSYSLLVLPDLLDKSSANPDQQTMTLPVMKKLAGWVKEGLTVVGPKPLHSPSLSGQPQADQRVRQLADELWGNCDGKTVTEHACGKGKVVWGQPIEQVLRSLNLGPDFSSKGDGKEFLYIHRRQDQKEIYFVFNRSENWATRACAFRVSKAAPEIWDAAGNIRKPAAFRSTGATTELSLSLPPFGGTFVVFDSARPASFQVEEVRCEGKSLAINGAESPEMPPAELCQDPQGRTKLLAWRQGLFEIASANGLQKAEAKAVAQPVEVEGPWSVSFKPTAPADKLFQATMDKLVPWQKHPDRNIRYFGGQATYRGSVKMDARRVNMPMMLDLGPALGDVAEVKINGKRAGSVWMAPYRLEVTGLFQAGDNTLEIVVGNRWINRLIGEIQSEGEPLPPAMMRNPFKEQNRPKDTPLVEAGLIGPIRIYAGEVLKP